MADGFILDELPNGSLSLCSTLYFSFGRAGVDFADFFGCHSDRDFFFFNEFPNKKLSGMNLLEFFHKFWVFGRKGSWGDPSGNSDTIITFPPHKIGFLGK